MTCADAHDLLQDALDDRLDTGSRAALDAHLAGCSSCRSFETDLAEMRRLFEATPAVTAPPEFAAAVMARLPAGRVTRLPRWVAPLTAAAAVLLALVVLDRGTGGGPIAKETADAPKALYALEDFAEPVASPEVEDATRARNSVAFDREVEERSVRRPTRAQREDDQGDDAAPPAEPSSPAAPPATEQPSEDPATAASVPAKTGSKKLLDDGPNDALPPAGPAGPATGADGGAGPGRRLPAPEPARKPQADPSDKKDAAQGFAGRAPQRRIVLECVTQSDVQRLADALASRPEVHETWAAPDVGGDTHDARERKNKDVASGATGAQAPELGKRRKDRRDPATDDLGELARWLERNVRSGARTTDLGLLRAQAADGAVAESAGAGDDRPADAGRSPPPKTLDRDETGKRGYGEIETQGVTVRLAALDAVLARLQLVRDAAESGAASAPSTPSGVRRALHGERAEGDAEELDTVDEAESDEAPDADTEAGDKSVRHAARQDLVGGRRLYLVDRDGRLVEIVLVAR